MTFSKSPGAVCIASQLLAIIISSSAIPATAVRVIPPGESVAFEVQKAHAAGDVKPRFILHARRPGSVTDYQVQVREAVSAVTSTTTTSVRGGESSYVNEDDVATMLVGDERNVIALIAVEKKGGRVNGIVQRDGEKINIAQDDSGAEVSFGIRKSRRVFFGDTPFSTHAAQLHLDSLFHFRPFFRFNRR